MEKRVYKFRIYPNKKQSELLNETLELARFTYNKQLELKINNYKEHKISLSQFDLNNSLIELKQSNPKLSKLHSQVLQNINQRISYAFNNFFRRLKNKENPGFPRFKSKNRYDSITYPQPGLVLNTKLYLTKIGKIQIIKHREIKGKIKTLTIKKTHSNKWYAYFSVEKDKEKKIPPNNKIAGIDLGLNHFYADSEGNLVNNPKYLKKTELKLKKYCREHSRKKKGSNNKNKSRLKLARLYEKISNQRLDFLHKESRKLADKHNIIAVENLQIKNMIRNKYLSKSISDASWNKFLQLLSYKVEETGGKLVEVNPRNTSQYCICGNKVEKTLAVRTHKCSNCGIEINRDVMSAMIIKNLAFNGSTVGSTGSNAWEDVSVKTSMNQESHLVVNKY